MEKNSNTEQVYSENLARMKKIRSKLARELKVKISFKDNCICVEGEPLEIHRAAEVIEALNLGFKLNQALLLKDEDFILEKINIKDLTKRHDLSQVRARVIGARGKTKETIENLSDCFVAIKDNRIGIIGRAEDMRKTLRALTSIVQGAKQSKVYGFLEEQRAKDKVRSIEDLGLRYKEKKK